MILASVVELTGCSGNGAGGLCESLGTCGGNPEGTWQVVSACTNLVAQKPQQAFAVPESGIPLPPTTSGGWCWDIS
ncbi:MAG TPA: hypothetical protein VL137_17735, partial [Polyangiaceae bacterium]|nr:hypothetical protein [Polyangiaceae bacterium]